MADHPLKGRPQTPEQIRPRVQAIRAAHARRLLADPQWAEEDRGHATPCWVWRRSVNPKGYPMVSLSRDGKKVTYRAHRYVYEQRVGPIPEGLTLDHLCNVRCCVNPDHLEPVTQKENVRRGLRRRAEAGLPRYGGTVA